MKREAKWDLLRAISCISVLLLHVAALYTEEATVYNSYPYYCFSFCDFLQIVTRTAVPCFVMLSGAFLLDKKSLNVVVFYKQSTSKLVIPTLVFGLGYAVVSFCGNPNIVDVLAAVFKGQIAGHLWFMLMLLGMYAVFPFLYYFKQNVDPNVFVIFSFGMVIISCIIHFTCILIWPVQFLEYLGYFLVGYYIRKNGKKFWGSIVFWVLLSVCSLLITYLLNEWQFYFGTYNSAFFRNPNYPTIIVASLAIFTAFSKMEISQIPNIFLSIAEHSMSIYMIHPLVINIFCKMTKTITRGMLPTPILFVPILFAVCMGVSYIAAHISDRILKRLCI